MRTEVNSKQMQTDVNRCIQMYIQMHIHLFTSAYGLVVFLNADVNRCTYICLHLFTSAYGLVGFLSADVNRCKQMYIHLFTSAYGLVGFFERRCKQMQTDVPTSAYIWLHLFTSAYTCLDRCTLM